MFFIVDKPVGPTCNQLLSHFKRLYQTKKAGHVGTLDPNASGLLLIATHGSTKLIPYLEKKDKTYEFEFDITRTSPSLDMGTDTIFWNGNKKNLLHNCTQDSIEKTCKEFIGEYFQSPPIFSAIWIDGKRAYHIARSKKHSGENTDYNESISCTDNKSHVLHHKKRLVKIYSVEVLGYSFPYITLRARVSSGTYIRSLAYDIGTKLGGTALVTKLRRVGQGDIQLKNNFINSSIPLHPVYFHKDELTYLTEVNFSCLFPDFNIRILTKEEYNNLQRGNRISETDNGESAVEKQFYICTYNSIPVAFCKEIVSNGKKELQVIKNNI